MMVSGLQDVPRNRTLVSQGWDPYTQVPSPTNFNPYAGANLHERNSLHYTVNEGLFYSNYATGEITPWLGESWKYNDDFTELTVKLRDGAEWSDGKPFTADDVVFTLNMLASQAPDMLMSSAIKEWVKEATVVDPLTVHIVLNKPGPRWARETLATGQAARLQIVPKHIWETVEDPIKFEFFDLEKGWPVGTGPYKLVKTGSNSIFYDLRDSWWALKTGLVKSMPEVQRVVYAPAPIDALPQLYANNDLDVGYFLEVGGFEAANGRNPNLTTWNEGGRTHRVPERLRVSPDAQRLGRTME